jgi:hypothetical protein
MPLQEDDWNNLLFTDPAGAVERIKRETLAEARAQAHRDYYQVTNRANWNKKFYSDYPALASNKEVVDEVIRELFTKVSSLPVETANQQIAERAEAVIQHRKRFDRIDEERAMWSGGPGFSGAPEPTPQDQGGTLSDTIKARRERRRERSLGRAMSGERI